MLKAPQWGSMGLGFYPGTQPPLPPMPVGPLFGLARARPRGTLLVGTLPQWPRAPSSPCLHRFHGLMPWAPRLPERLRDPHHCSRDAVPLVACLAGASVGGREVGGALCAAQM